MVRHDLRQVADSYVARLVNRTRCWKIFAYYKLHYGRLSRPVLTNEAYFVIVADVEIDIVQQGEIPVGYSKSV